MLNSNRFSLAGRGNPFCPDTAASFDVSFNFEKLEIPFFPLLPSAPTPARSDFFSHRCFSMLVLPDVFFGGGTVSNYGRILLPDPNVPKSRVG